MIKEYTIKRFGKYGLHIILKKADGFEEGMKVKVIPNGRELQNNTMQYEKEDKILQRNTESNTLDYNVIRRRLLKDEEFIELIITKLQGYTRRW